MCSASKVKHFEEFPFDSSQHAQNNCEMLETLNFDFHCGLISKLRVESSDQIVRTILQTLNGSEHPHRSIGSLIINILDDESILIVDVGIGADVRIQLFKFALGLCEIHCSFDEHRLVADIGHPLELSLGIAHDIDPEIQHLVVAPLGQDKKEIVAHFEEAPQLHPLTLGVGGIHPPVIVVALSHH